MAKCTVSIDPSVSYEVVIDNPEQITPAQQEMLDQLTSDKVLKFVVNEKGGFDLTLVD
jgi:hypothetical protein